MPTLIEHEIEGTLEQNDSVDFSRQKFVVHALVQGNEVAHSEVDNSGRYKLTFEYPEEKPVTELRITAPTDVQSTPVTVSDVVAPGSFVKEADRIIAHQDLAVPAAPQFFPPRIYRAFGQVFAQIGHTIEPLAGAKLAFEGFLPRFVAFPPGAPPTWQRIDLGHCLTGPDGKYSINFLVNLPYYPPISTIMGRPYAHVHISEVVMGVEYELLSESISFVNLGHLDFLVQKSASTVCFDFQSLPLGPAPNPLRVANATLTVFDGASLPNTKIEQRLPGRKGLNCSHKLVIDLPFPTNKVQLGLLNQALPSVAQAFDRNGTLVLNQTAAQTGQLYRFQLSSALEMKQIVLKSPNDEAWLFDFCY